MKYPELVTELNHGVTLRHLLVPGKESQAMGGEVILDCCALFQAEIAQLQEQLALKDAEIERLQSQLSRTSSYTEVAERGKRRGIKAKNPNPHFNFALVAAWHRISKEYKEVQE